MTDQLIELVRIDGKAKTRDEAINEVAEMLISAGAVTPDYRDAMFERESSVSTYMGNYLAIPHGTLEALSQVMKSALAIVRYDSPIDWDGNEVRFVIGIAGKDGTHLNALGSIAMLFSEMQSVENLLGLTDVREITAKFAEARSF
jgi:mannitol/fructose-specific phosphotransferase system IIA component